ncbi:uncharacterized protein N7458_008902 [Penicillium daleae]|uniref:Uncharacterized protein n=1 Tax=Penicillium daleae TaxID=63821 RepID=A0AAD6BYR1_9EURO|nr:uncharacterized protein N7458_008902 [Penicillium daleae]KAJ5437904.1 hypothetical protein N7458_008902 [Penicillium daleae]
MDLVFSKKYQPVPKAEPDDDAGSDTTVTNRRRRRHPTSLFPKRNLAAITISSLLLVLILLVFTMIAILTFEPLREVIIVKSSPLKSAAWHGQRQCLPTTPRRTLSCGNSTTEA